MFCIYVQTKLQIWKQQNSQLLRHGHFLRYHLFLLFMYHTNALSYDL